MAHVQSHHVFKDGKCMHNLILHMTLRINNAPNTSSHLLLPDRIRITSYPPPQLGLYLLGKHGMTIIWGGVWLGCEDKISR